MRVFVKSVDGRGLFVGNGKEIWGGGAILWLVKVLGDEGLVMEVEGFVIWMRFWDKGFMDYECLGMIEFGFRNGYVFLLVCMG